MTTYIVFIDFVVFIVGLALGVGIYIQQPKEKIFKIFALTVLGMVGWNLSIFLLLSEIGNALLLGRLVFSFGALFIMAFGWFVFNFPVPMRLERSLSFLFGLLGVGFFILPLTPWFVSHVEVVDGAITGDLNPQLFGILTIYYFASYLFSFFVLLARALRAKGVDRGRLFQVFLGFSLFLFPMMTTQLFLPLVFQDFRFNNLGPAFSIFLVIFLANAILRYRLFNIRWIVSRGFLFTLLATLVVWAMTTITFLISNTVPHKIALGVGALIIVLAFKPLQALVESLINKLVNRGWYDPKMAMQELFEIVRTEGDLEQLVKRVSERFIQFFSLKQFGLAVFSVNALRAQESYLRGFDKSVVKKVKRLADVASNYHGEIVELGELKWRYEYGSGGASKAVDKKSIKVLEEAGVQTLIPLMIGKDIIGLMFFGDRRYDRALRPQDLSFLKLVSAGISPALENAAKFAHITNLYTKISEADRAKSEFINVVSHSLRTPLSAVRWNLETLLETANFPKPMREMMNDSYDRTIFLANTLDGLFDVLAIERGKLKLDRREIKLKNELQEILVPFSKRAKDKGFKFISKVEDAKLSVDKKRFLFVCTALLQNAFAFTNAGKVEFIVSKKRNAVEITVRDTGIGIPSKDLRKIFNKFFRGSNAISQSTDGQGLSLYIVKRTVDAHGGDVDLKSKLGKGTEVTITLPTK